MVTISARRVGRATFELAPGHTKKGITARQAKTILSSVRPRDAVGRTRKRLVLGPRPVRPQPFASWTGTAPLDASSGEQIRRVVASLPAAP